VSVGLRPNLIPFALASARPGAVRSRMRRAFELRRDPQHGKHKLGKIRGRIDNRLGNRT
jgi:hypothetical protein